MNLANGIVKTLRDNTAAAMLSPAPCAAIPPGSNNKENLTKITFKVNHPPSRPQVDDVGVTMYVMRSIQGLGAWDPMRGKRMTRASDGNWELSVYMPSDTEFLYQYTLKDHDGMVVWESSLERKQSTSLHSSTLKVHDNISAQEESSHAQKHPQPLPADTEGDPAALNLHLIQAWGGDDDDDDKRDSLLPPPSFSITNSMSSAQKKKKARQSVSGFQDCDETSGANGHAASASPSIAKPKGAGGVQTEEPSIINWMSQTLAVPMQIHQAGVEFFSPAKGAVGDVAVQQISAKLQEAHAKIHSLVEEKERWEAAALALREQQENSVACINKERILAQEAQRQCDQERESQKMHARRLRKTLRDNAGRFAESREALSSLKTDMKAMQAECSKALSCMAEELAQGITEMTVGPQRALEDTKEKLDKETAERRRLHNQVLELKGNIRVFCRVRPAAQGAKSAVLFPSNEELVLTSGGKHNSFSYDKVFAPDATQDEVYTETQPLVVSCLDGYNVCVFAYGQTGSGKTHTMDMMNTRSLSDLFHLASEKRAIAAYTFKLTAIEIYNETIKDLLEPNDASGKPKKLDVKTDAATGASTVPDIHYAPVACIEDVQHLMSVAHKTRHTSSTSMNEHSSRSHLILTVHIVRKDLVKDGTLFGKMNLIDLAGSERLSRTCAEGDRLQEAKHINKSLSALGNCVSSLVSKGKHVPYRDSKLTFLLQDSLGMDSKTLMFVCASPTDQDAAETLCSLQFAARVSKVELGAAKKRGDGGSAMLVKEAETRTAMVSKKAEDDMAKAQKRIDELETMLAASQDSKAKEQDRKQGAMEKREAALQEREKQLEARERAVKDKERAAARPAKKTLVTSSASAFEAPSNRKQEIVARTVTSNAPSVADEAETVVQTAAVTKDVADFLGDVSMTEGMEEESGDEDARALAEEESVNVSVSVDGDEKENATGNLQRSTGDTSGHEVLSLEERLAQFRARKEESRRRIEGATGEVAPLSPKAAKTPRKKVDATSHSGQDLGGPRAKRVGASPSSLTSGAERVINANRKATKPKPFALSRTNASRPKTAPVSREGARNATAGWR